MRKTSQPLLVRCFLAIIFTFTFHELSLAQNADAALNDPIYKLQGEYLKGEQGIQIAALGEDEFRATVFNGGLPGAGWNRTEPQVIEMTRDDLEDYLSETGAKKIERSSPTLNASPPENATILFDGTEASLKQYWNEGAKLAEGKFLAAGATSKEKFNSYRLHLEFRTPWMPQATGQGRGNSGVYHQGRYETQVLDSFGFDNLSNTCGAIYDVKPGTVAAVLPPLVWQTYDIEYTAPQWDSSKKKVSNAKLSVWLNGILIHRDQEVQGPTRAAPLPESPDPGPLYLQDHGNPVHYRNIWLVPIDSVAIAQRPRVASFERFASLVSSEADTIEAGRLLISELACQSCHQIDSLSTLVQAKQAPKLENVGTRVRSEYFKELLAAPHLTKTGTTMPDTLHGLNAADRETHLDALAAFLKSSGKARHVQRVTAENVQRGEELYKRIGCAVCHGLPDGRFVTATSIPLPDLAKKYVWDGLVAFLKNPHAIRPAGRMPAMHLNDEEVRDVASYLLKDAVQTETRPNMRYEVYHGKWDKLPDFNSLTPVATGNCEGLDLTVAQRTNDFAVRFKSYLPIDTAGKYKFHLGSDDGSKLFINNKLVVDVDGIHPHQTRSGEIDLQTGLHELEIVYFQGGGEWTIAAEIEGLNINRQPLEGWIQLDKTPPSIPASEVLAPEKIALGKKLFVETGCNQCHQLGFAEPTAAKYPAVPQLTSASTNKGCLAVKPPANAPNYHLSDTQRQAIVAALSAPKLEQPTPEVASRHTMAKLNCIACHVRDGWGGPEADKLELFTSTTPEMGEEGRLPPLLTGAGDKLTDGYLNHVLRQGDRQRPYMLVRMPQFGEAAGSLAANWIATDRAAESNTKTNSAEHTSEEAEFRTLAAGRQLAGIKGLACVQCHTFGNERALGIQAINLLTMSQRLRPEWFHRYMLQPTRYRPGTRMPASFSDGKSVLTSVYDGDADRQIEALWKYLSQGNQAATPEGLQRNQIVLEPSDRPVIYRNFLEGLSARGIAVGYPGGLNIAWDAETLRMALIWHGQFIDASMHWRDRGVGRQRPLGDHVLTLEPVSAVSILANADAEWPAVTTREQGYQFKGYRLDSAGQPTFRYQIAELEVADHTTPVLIEGTDPALRRNIAINASKDQPQSAYVRLAVGNQIQAQPDNAWKIDDRFEIRLDKKLAAQAKLRKSQGKQELIIFLDNISSKPTSVEYEIRW